MSKHAKPTLVRFWLNDGDDEYLVNILVDDWNITRADGWAEFTIPLGHPVADRVFDCGVVTTRLLVMESEEGEWRIDTMTCDKSWPPPMQDRWRIRCESWASRLHRIWPSDQWIIDHEGVTR